MAEDAARRLESPFSSLPLVVDSSVNCEAQAANLAGKGVKVVIRYYSRAGGPKVLTQREAHAIHGAGMAIGLVYQNNNRVIERFSEEEADRAAKYCMGRDAGMNPNGLETISHPSGTVIYFGIDTNDFSDTDLNTVAKYFTHIKKVFNDKRAPFLVGVYGSGHSCDWMRRHAAVEYFWLAGVSTGWAGTKSFYNEPPAAWNLFQNALEVPLGVSVDTNLVNPAAGGKLGAFDRTGLINGLDDTVVRRSLRFVKPGPHATFFKTPGGEKIIHYIENKQHQLIPLDYIPPTRMISVLEEVPDWSKVEVTFAVRNVGTIYQGYVRSEMLASIDKIP